MRRAIEGLEEFKKHLDTVIVVPNQTFKIASKTTTFEDRLISQQCFKTWSAKCY